MGKVIRDGFRLSVISYSGAAIGYLNKILIFTNILSEEQLGLVNLLVNVAALFAQGANLGTPLVIGRFFPFLKTADHRNNGLLFWTLLFSALGFLACAAFLLGFREPILSHYSESPLLGAYYLYLIPVILSTAFFNLFDMYLRMYGKNLFSGFVSDILLRLSNLIAVLAYAFGWVDFHGFVGLYIFFQCMPALLLLLYMLKHKLVHLSPVRNAFTHRLYRIAMSYGLISLLNGLSNFSFTAIDQIMLASMGGAAGLKQTGIYTTTSYFVSLLMMPYRAITRIVQPDVSLHSKNRNREELAKIYRQTTLILLISGCYLFLMLWINLDSLYHVMPISYREGKPVFLLLAIGQLATLYTGINGMILINSKKFRYDMAANLLLIGVTILTNYWLIPRFGMVGAAMATTLTLVLYNTVRSWFVWHFFRIHPFAPVDLGIVALTLVCIVLSGLMPPAFHWVADISIRSVLFSLLFGWPIYMWKLSPELNRSIDELLAKLTGK